VTDAVTIADNDALIRKEFPSFRKTLDAGFLAVWEGVLRPTMKSYRVRITYIPKPDFGDSVLLNPSIEIRVVDPVLGICPRGDGKPIPHTYFTDLRPEQPVLCIFDPAAGDWNPSKPLAETIIRWASEWLFWFEERVRTGEWRGTGRDHAPGENQWQQSYQPSLDQQGPIPAAAFAKVGRLERTSVSFPLMAAASAGSSLPAYWRRLRTRKPMGSR
jgi:hypothetical protein